MSKASRCFTGKRQSVGTPTLNKEQYFQLIRAIRNEKEKAALRQQDGELEKPAERTGES